MINKTKIKTVIIWLTIFILGIISSSAADYIGTIGTRFTISGSGFGISKPKVYIEYEQKPGIIKQKNVKVESWNDHSISCVWTKKISVGTYNLLVRPKIKNASPISAGAIQILGPVIDSIDPQPGMAGDTITLNGQFFTSKKPRIYIQEPNSSERRRCNVISADMNPETGESSLKFAMPQISIVNLSEYKLILENNIDETTFYVPNNLTWKRIFGGDFYDSGYSVALTHDGGYVITGCFTFQKGYMEYRDVFLIKTDSHGYMQWSKTYGGKYDDQGVSVQQTSDGGYIIVGEKQKTEFDYFGTDYDVYLIKTNSNGQVLWEKTYGGPNEDFGYSVQETSEGDFIIVGQTYSFSEGNIYLLKTDSEGNVLWEKVYGGEYDDSGGYSVQQSADGGYVITGYVFSYSKFDYDIYLLKTDSNGNFQWAQTYGGDQYWGKGFSVQQTFDGGYIVTGGNEDWLNTEYFEYDAFLLKADANGNMQWLKTFGGANDDVGYSVKQASDGGFVMTGINPEIWWEGVYLVKTDSNGDIQWDKTYSGWAGASVQETVDEGFVIVGETTLLDGDSTNAFLMKTDSQGNIQ